METLNLNAEIPERLLKASEIAEVLNVSKAFAYQLMSRGELRTVELGSARRVRLRDLEDFITLNLSPPIMEVDN